MLCPQFNKFPHSLKAKTFRALAFLLVILFVASHSAEAKVSKKGNKKLFRKNSPIYYVSNIKPMQSFYSTAFNAYSAINSAYNTYNSIASTLNSDINTVANKVHKPIVDSSLNTEKNSQIYKIPLRFMSNAKPIDIITGE